MKNYRKSLYMFLYMVFLQGCIGSAYDKKLNGQYYLSAIDVKEDMIIGYQDGDYGIGVIKEVVFAVGQNDRFIIAKQHPKDSSYNINKGVTNYFIIPFKEKIAKSVEKNIYGPLTMEEFEQKREDLNIQSVNFTILFKDLE